VSNPATSHAMTETSARTQLGIRLLHAPVGLRLGCLPTVSWADKKSRLPGGLAGRP